MATLSYLSCPHFPGNRLWRFPGKWGRVEGGSLVAATCIPDRDKPDGRFKIKTWYLPTHKAVRSPCPGRQLRDGLWSGEMSRFGDSHGCD